MGAAMNLFGLRKDGTEFPVDIMLKPMRQMQLVTLSFVRDATEQREALSCAQKDLQLRSIVPSYATTRSISSITEGHVTTWNPARNGSSNIQPKRFWASTSRVSSHRRMWSGAGPPNYCALRLATGQN